ncbi:MAG: hypothetical protein WAV68_02845 [Candidatus Nanogingivalis sp.]
MNKEEFRTKIRRVKYRISSDLMTIDNLIIAVSIIVAVAWIWGSISAMERNYALQQQLEVRKRERLLTEIKHKTLQYESEYLKSDEYRELAARENLGLVAQGESVLILSEYPEEKIETSTSPTQKQSNFSQWMNFLFGGNVKKTSK